MEAVINFFPEELIREKYVEHFKKLSEKRENEWWVTDLVRCHKRRELQMRFKEFFIVTPSEILGDLIHKALLIELGLRFGCKIEQEFEKEIDNYIVKGRVDALCGDLVVEVKYMRDFQGNKPLPHHVEQVKLYMWLTGAKKGLLIYVTPNRIVKYLVNEPYGEEEIRALFLATRTPKWDWECDYCEYAQFCEKRISKSSKHG